MAAHRPEFDIDSGPSPCYARAGDPEQQAAAHAAGGLQDERGRREDAVGTNDTAVNGATLSRALPARTPFPLSGYRSGALRWRNLRGRSVRLSARHVGARTKLPSMLVGKLEVRVLAACESKRAAHRSTRTGSCSVFRHAVF